MNNNIFQMSFKDINPQLNYMILNPLVYGNKYGPRKIYDYHLRYVVNGKGKITIGNNSYDVKEGDLIFTPPNVTHDMVPDINNPMMLYGIHFNFTPVKSKFTFARVSDIENFVVDDVAEFITFTDFEGFPDCINCSSNLEIIKTLEEMMKIYKSQKKFYRLELNGMLKSLLAIIAQHISIMAMDSEEKKDINTNKNIETIIAYIYENCNQELTYESIGEKFHFHPNHINRLVQAYSGKSLRQYIINTRIKRATDLLLHSDQSINKISHIIGYNDVNYFFKVFKKKTGLTPTQIRTQNKY